MWRLTENKTDACMSRCKGGSEGETMLNRLGKRGMKDMKEFAFIEDKVALEPGLTV